MFPAKAEHLWQELVIFHLFFWNTGKKCTVIRLFLPSTVIIVFLPTLFFLPFGHRRETFVLCMWVHTKTCGTALDQGSSLWKRVSPQALPLSLNCQDGSKAEDEFPHGDKKKNNFQKDLTCSGEQKAIAPFVRHKRTHMQLWVMVVMMTWHLAGHIHRWWTPSDFTRSSVLDLGAWHWSCVLRYHKFRGKVERKKAWPRRLTQQMFSPPLSLTAKHTMTQRGSRGKLV